MIFRSPIFRKLLASAFLLIAVTLGVLDFDITRFTARREVQSVEQRLEAEARILQTEAADVPRSRNWKIGRTKPRSAPARASRLSTRKAWPWPIPNTIPRPWRTTPPGPRSWRLTGTAWANAVRHSATLNQDLCYVALRLTYHDEPG